MFPHPHHMGSSISIHVRSSQRACWLDAIIRMNRRYIVKFSEGKWYAWAHTAGTQQSWDSNPRPPGFFLTLQGTLSRPVLGWTGCPQLSPEISFQYNFGNSLHFSTVLSFIQQISIEPWLVWLSGLSAGLWTKGSRVWFPVMGSCLGCRPGLQ